jgi:hypothetical protein
MTEPVQIALIASAGPTLIGLLNLAHQIKVARKVFDMGENIKNVEVQTNHIKDALVASTALASHAEGVQDEKIRTALEANIPINTVVAGNPINPPIQRQ